MLLCMQFRLPPRAAWAKSVGGGYVIGQFAMAARSGWQRGFDTLLSPHEAGDWLPWLVIAAVAITVLAAYAPRPWQRWLVSLAALLALIAPVRLLAGSVYVTTRWSTAERIGVILVWFVALAATWTILARSRPCRRGRLRGALLILVATATAIALTLSGSLISGERAGIVAASLTGALAAHLVLTKIRRNREANERTSGRTADSNTAAPASEPDPGLSGAAGALTMSLGGLILVGYFYAELARASAFFLLAALCAAGGPLPTSRNTLWSASLRIGLCLAALAIALAITYATMQSDAYH
jgi:hypothetical protein